MIYANSSLDEKSRELLDLHEKYRQDLVDCKVDGQPPAKYMSPLKWNYNLAAQAQTLANKCILQHDKRHSDEFDWVGQNIALHPTIKSWLGPRPQTLDVELRVVQSTVYQSCVIMVQVNVTDDFYCVDCFSGNWNREKPYEVKSRELCPRAENTNNARFVSSTIGQLDEFTVSNVLNGQTISLGMVNSSNDGNPMNIKMFNNTSFEPNTLMNDSICYDIFH
ncbi:unnamed protein product [Schistosoma margrebowiei]|uniref:Uncharacterized protein n=1 Tax=Schistosoma margrebowiei TaxID=48269 RepID=A0A183N4N8_9TREM|nr:unnamed protein product [Schistosoma margrebowiei]